MNAMSSQPKKIVNVAIKPLVIAIRKNNIEKVKQFLASQQQDYKQESNAITPLHHAAEGGNIEIVKLIFSHGYGTLNALNRQNKTPFQLALKKNHEDVVKYFIENGAKSAYPPKELEKLIDSYVKTEKVGILKYLIQSETISNYTIFSAVKENRLESLKCLLEFGDIKKKSSFNFLHLAAANGNLEMVKLFFNKGHNVIGAKNDQNKLPLHLAVTNGHEDVVKFLMDNGARNELTFKEFNDLIEQSIMSNCLCILKSFNSRNTISDSVPNFAASNGHLEILKLLMECGVKIIWDSSSDTPLQCAAKCGHLDIIKYLLDNEHVINEAKSFNGISPLSLAVSEGHLETVKYFYKLQTVGKVNHMHKNDSPSSLLNRAAAFGRIDIMKYLIECGANIHAKDCGETVLHSAIFSGQIEVVQFLLELGAEEILVSESIPAEKVKDEILTILLEAGHSMKPYFDEKEPIVFASKLGYSKLVEALISSDVNTISKEDYKSALNLAVIARKAKVVNILLKAGANLNDTTETRLKTFEYVISKTYKHKDYRAQFEILTNLLDYTPKKDFEYFVLSCIDWAVEEQSSNTIFKLLLECDFNNNCKLSINCLDKRIQIFNTLTNHIEKIETLVEFESLILKQDPLPSFKREFKLALISRIIYLKSLFENYEDEEAHLNFVKFYNLEEWCQQCEEEINLMKKKILSSDVTYHDFLLRSVHKVVGYIRNENLYKNLHYRELKLYREYFERKIASAKSRSLIIDQSQKCLYDFIRKNLQIHLPIEIIDKISEYLCVAELRRLQQAFPHLSS